MAKIFCTHSARKTEVWLIFMLFGYPMLCNVFKKTPLKDFKVYGLIGIRIRIILCYNYVVLCAL